MKMVANVEESLFAFKIDNYYPRKTTIPTEPMVDAAATTRILRDAKKFKNYDQTFQPGNHNMELANPIYQPLRSGRIWHKVNF